MFGTSEQAVKIYGLWFELKKHYFCSMFHCRTSKFAGESAIEFPSFYFLGTNSRSIHDQVLWSKLCVLIFSQFSPGWCYGNVQETIKKSSKQDYIYIYRQVLSMVCRRDHAHMFFNGQPSVFQAWFTFLVIVCIVYNLIYYRLKPQVLQH